MGEAGEHMEWENAVTTFRFIAPCMPYSPLFNSTATL